MDGLNNGREEVVEQCKGCEKIVEQDSLLGGDPSFYCLAYLIPSSKWRTGKCPLATHLQKEAVGERKINPLKQSKRSMAGK